MRVVISVNERDAPGIGGRTATGGEALVAFAAALQEAGLHVESRKADAVDVETSGSSWARRLAIPRQRPAWLLLARKPG